MKKNIVWLMVLAAAVLVLTGESCVTKDTEVDVPVRTDQDLPFQVRTQGSATVFVDSVAVNFADLINDALDEVDVDSLVSVNIENGYWHVVEDYDNPSPIITGRLTVRNLETGEALVLLDLPSTSISSLLGPFQVAPLQQPAVEMLNDAFNDYIDWAQGGGMMPNMEFMFIWRTEADSAPLEFDWEARIRLTVVGTVTVEVPDVL